MVRPLSPDSARIAGSLMDHYDCYGPDSIESIINYMRTPGDRKLLLADPKFAPLVRTRSPEDPAPYKTEDVVAFRKDLLSVSSISSLLADSPPHASDPSSPSGSSYMQAAGSSSRQSGTDPKVSRLAPKFSPSELTAALILQNDPSLLNPLFDPLFSSGNYVSSRSFTSGSEPQSQ